MSISNEELKQFIDYFPKDNLIFGINMESINQIESTVVWYKYNNNEMVVHHILNPQTSKVIVWNKISLNIPISEFFNKMKQWEHEYCIIKMEENYQGDEHCYTYFNYTIDQWNDLLKLSKR
jgi:hypothetical protein